MWGAIIGGAISAAGALKANSASAAFSKEGYKHRYQWQVQDMKRAGINPMLAATQGAGSVGQPNFENVGAAAVSGAEKGNAAETAAKQREVMQSVIDLNSASAGKARAETMAIPHNIALTDALVADANQRVQYGVASTENMKKQTENLGISALVMGAQIARENAGVFKTMAEYENALKTADLIEQEVAEAISRTKKNYNEITMQDLNMSRLRRLIPQEYLSELLNNAEKIFGIPRLQNQFNHDRGFMGAAEPYIRDAGQVADVVGKIFGMPASALILRSGMKGATAPQIAQPGLSSPVIVGGYPYK